MYQATQKKTTTIQPVATEQASAADKYRDEYPWITNEGLLRDEGTLFGIAGAPIEDKLNAIRNFYYTRKAIPIQKKEGSDQQITTLNTSINSINIEVQKLQAENTTRLTEDRKPFNLVPVAFQFLVYTCVCYFNYYLLKFWLSSAIVSESICIGLYLFGLSSVFLGRSIMYNSDQTISTEKDTINREQWKVYLEEFGVPAIVALFICTLTFRHYPVEYTIAAFIFFFFLFLFSGKGLINQQFRLRKELASWLNYTRGTLKFNKEKRQLLKKKTEAENSIMTLRKETQEPATILRELGAEEAYKIHVFLSEYNLASGSRQSLNKSQLKKLA
jgi:hypothetical protein